MELRAALEEADGRVTDEEEKQYAARALKAALEAADPEPTEGENASFGAEFFRGGMEASAAMTAASVALYGGGGDSRAAGVVTVVVATPSAEVAESADRVAAADSEWERAVDIIAVEHMQRVERLQRISAARELQAGLVAAEQQITAAAELRQALEHAEEGCSGMEGQPGLPMEGQLAQEIQLPVGMSQGQSQCQSQCSQCSHSPVSKMLLGAKRPLGRLPEAILAVSCQTLVVVKPLVSRPVWSYLRLQ